MEWRQGKGQVSGGASGTTFSAPPSFGLVSATQTLFGKQNKNGVPGIDHRAVFWISQAPELVSLKLRSVNMSA
jgi:hypothetical protein